MKKFLSFTLVLSAALWATPSQAALNVLACEPEWAALAAELGGDKLKVASATTAKQDPHRIEARPSLIARTRNADLLVCTGLELEAGWLPVLLQQSGNARIAPGQPGNFMAGEIVARIDVPARIDRGEGDVHASGNPHIQQDPRNIALVAAALSRRLADIDPANASLYQARHEDFAARWSAAMQKWAQQAAPLKGISVVEHHKNMAYLLRWLGMHSAGTLEPKPGVEPSAAHLNGLLAQLQRQQANAARMVLRAAYQDPRPSQWLAARTQIIPVSLPFTVGGSPQATDLFSLFDDTVQRLLAGVK